MLEDLIKRDDVLKMLDDICNSSCYYDKKVGNFTGCQTYFCIEQMLLLFYDALYKYKIIIGDMEYFTNFLEQFDKVVRKLDNFLDISRAINRIIGRLCEMRVGTRWSDDQENKETVLRYIYDSYIVNGYYIHGYAPHYYSDIFEKGFMIEDYHNLYDKFVKVQKIFKKRDYGYILEKDFTIKKASFTDSFLQGCYYSLNAPMFFSSLLCRNGVVDSSLAASAYEKDDYDLCLRNLYLLMAKANLSESEKVIVLDAFNSEWKLLDKKNCNISLMLVPKKLFGKSKFDIEKFIDDNKNVSLIDAVCTLLDRRENIDISRDIKKEDITLINLYGYKKFYKGNTKEPLVKELEKTFIKSDDEFAFSNTYGKVSILLLLGTFFISMGVILTIIMFS